ncbi:unnamed protein product [Protopolystoma xenopodis]|uniref:Uncharacterized protein n=1 Tax=Protopolystoma xenopodis TaxID=117903 RepID=A0A448WL30_9PLAT|nr:unnamed protein product [Protopolystoma xenopodis]
MSIGVVRRGTDNFRVDYPLTSGTYVQFRCLPVPSTNLSGEITFNISSPDPRIILKAVYDDPNSIFPSQVICKDLNPELDSKIMLFSDKLSMKNMKLLVFSESPPPWLPRKANSDGQFPERSQVIDFRQVGGFDPARHAGQYTCEATNINGARFKKMILPEITKTIPGS